MAIGGAMGVATTTAASLANGVNPLTGKVIASSKVESLVNSATNVTTLVDGKIQGFVQGNAQTIFQDLIKGAQHVRNNLYVLPDGTYINYHPSTSTGIPTIDINKGGYIYNLLCI